MAAIDRVTAAGKEPRLGFSQTDDGTLLLSLGGDWMLKARLPPRAEVGRSLEAIGSVRRLAFDATRLGAWDSGLLAFLVGVQDLCKTRDIQIDSGGLPDGARQLLKLATAVPERKGARRTVERPDFLTLVGNESLALWRSGGQMLEFLGEALRSFGRLLLGKARYAVKQTPSDRSRKGDLCTAQSDLRSLGTTDANA